MACACVLLAVKVENQHHTLEHIVRVAHRFTNKHRPTLHVTSEEYCQLRVKVIAGEQQLLNTFDFNTRVDLPQTHIKTIFTLLPPDAVNLYRSACNLTNCFIQMSTVVLLYSATTIACVCIYLNNHWAGIEIPIGYITRRQAVVSLCG